MIVSMYEKVIERLLWNTAQHEYSTCNDVNHVVFPVNATETHPL